MKEIAIGEEIRLRCVEAPSRNRCAGCVFDFGDDECQMYFWCSGAVRKDGKQVQFKLMEDKL